MRTAQGHRLLCCSTFTSRELTNLAARSDEAVEVLALPLNDPERSSFFHDDACPNSGGLCFALQYMIAEQP